MPHKTLSHVTLDYQQTTPLFLERYNRDQKSTA